MMSPTSAVVAHTSAEATVRPQLKTLPNEIISQILTFAIQDAIVANDEYCSTERFSRKCRRQAISLTGNLHHPLHDLFLVSKAVKEEVERLTSILDESVLVERVSWIICRDCGRSWVS
jgi:hypothetical protein